MHFRELRVQASRLVSDHSRVAGLRTPFHWTAHHVRQIYAALLPKGYVLDGSSVIQITCGTRGEEPQYRQNLGSSEYFVDDFDFVAYARASPNERQRIILSTVRAALCDIASRVGKQDAELRSTAAAVAEHEFRYSVEIGKLKRFVNSTGRTVRVFRHLALELGETWALQITERGGSLVAEHAMGKSPQYLDCRDSYKSAELAEDAYIIRDNLGYETFRLDVG